MADILNVKLDEDEGVDSFSMLPLFSTESEKNYKRNYLLCPKSLKSIINKLMKSK